MKISKKAYYGLRAVLTLAQAEGSLSIHAIAEAEHLPEGYLEKILQALRRANIVEAKKGTNGGYALKQPIEHLSVWDILHVLDGPVKVFAPTVQGVLPCLQPSHCQTNHVLRALEEKIAQSLSSIRIQEIVEVNDGVKH